jgi:hypothetical protein
VAADLTAQNQRGFAVVARHYPRHNREPVGGGENHCRAK